MTIYSVTETSGCKHVLNVTLHPNGFCVWCVWYLSILFSCKLKYFKRCSHPCDRVVRVCSSPPFSLPLKKKKLRLAYDMLNLLVASKPGVWSNRCFAEWQTGISDWKQNLNFGSLGLQGLVSSFPNLWKFPSQGSFPNPPSKIMVSLKWLFPVSDFD